MIITCEECTTRFKLDDARIPEKGAKVRCSKCKHAFFVKPQASAGDRVEHAVARALAEDEVETKDLTTPGAGDLRSAGDSASALRPPDDQSAQSAIDDFEESDWEFNTDETTAGGEELDGFQQPPGLSLGDDVGDTADLALDDGAPDLGLDPAGLDLEGETGGRDDSGSEVETQPHVGVDAAREAVDDLLGGADDDEEDEDLFDTSPGAVEHGLDALLDDADGPSQADCEPGPEPEARQDPIDAALDDLGLEAPAAAPPAAAPAAAPPAAAPAAAGDGADREELGEPGEWDIFGEEAEPARSSGPAASQQLVIGRIGQVSPEPRPPVQLDPEPSAAGVWGRRIVQGIGWAAVCALTALLLHQALWVTPRVAPGAATSQEFAGIQATAIDGRWVENTSGAPIFVVSGRLASLDRARTPGARLAVRLLDAAGSPLLDEAADLGLELPMRALREESPASLRATQAESARALAWQTLFPGREVRVVAVLEELPAAARRFELMAVPVAQPASPPAAGPEAGPRGPGDLVAPGASGPDAPVGGSDGPSAEPA